MTQIARRLVAQLALLALLLGGTLAPPGALPAELQQSPPRGIAIPEGSGQNNLDGSCSDFGDALVQTFDDAGAISKVYLKHDGSFLFVCIQAAAGTFSNRFASVYLDPQGDGYRLFRLR